MLNVELVDKIKLNNKRQVYNKIPWFEEESSMPTSRSKDLKENKIRSRIKNKVIKISCSQNQYIDFPKIKKRALFTTGSFDDNSLSEFSVYYNKPSEFYIDIQSDLVELTKNDGLMRPYLVHVVNDQNNSIEKYYLIITLNYKNLTKVDNPDFQIGCNAYLHKLNNRNIFINSVTTAFLVVIISWLIKAIWFTFSFTSVQFFEWIIISTFIAQEWFRFSYIKTTKYNDIADYLIWKYRRVFLKKKESRYKNRFTEKEVKRRLIKYSEKFKRKYDKI